jgi:predicted PurR-regulated permease PerM
MKSWFSLLPTPEGRVSVCGAPYALQDVSDSAIGEQRQRDPVSLHPLAILLALTGGAIVAGILGALLAVPMTAVVWTAIMAWAETGPGVGGTASARPTWSGS